MWRVWCVRNAVWNSGMSNNLKLKPVGSNFSLKEHIVVVQGITLEWNDKNIKP